MPEQTKTRAEVAADAEAAAAKIVSEPGANGADVLVAQVSATLAVSNRLADLTDAIKEAGGGIEDRLSDVRQGMA